MEAQVLEQNNLAISGLVNGLLDLGTNAVLGEDDTAAQELLELGNDGSQAVLGVGLAVRTAQVRHQDDSLGAILNSVLDGGQSTNDALVVGDLLVGIKGDVEVDLCYISLCPLSSQLYANRRTRIRTRLPLRSTSVMASLLERDILLRGD